MKALLITVAAGIAASLLATAAQAADIHAIKYNTKAALIGQRAEVAPSVTVATVTHEFSAKYALLGGHPVVTTTARPVELVSLSSKSITRGVRASCIELAPLK
ncbi:MAG: hypothetical protein ABSA12_11060 [Verrucomicrobiia bacterium]|jgi:hypothetical protein